MGETTEETHAIRNNNTGTATRVQYASARPPRSSGACCCVSTQADEPRQRRCHPTHRCQLLHVSCRQRRCLSAVASSIPAHYHRAPIRGAREARHRCVPGGCVEEQRRPSFGHKLVMVGHFRLLCRSIQRHAGFEARAQSLPRPTRQPVAARHH